MTVWFVGAQIAHKSPACKEDAGSGNSEAQHPEASTPDRPKAAVAQAAGSATPHSPQCSAIPAAELASASAPEAVSVQAKEGPSGQNGAVSPSQPAAGPSIQPTDGMVGVASTPPSAKVEEESPSISSKSADAPAASMLSMSAPFTKAAVSIVPAAASAVAFGIEPDIASADCGAVMTMPAGEAEPAQNVSTVSDTTMEDQPAAPTNVQPEPLTDTAAGTMSFTHLMTADSVDMDDTYATLPHLGADNDIPMPMHLPTVTSADASTSSAMDTAGFDSEAVSQLGTAVPVWGQQGAALDNLGQPTITDEDMYGDLDVPLLSDSSATGTLPESAYPAAVVTPQQPFISAARSTWSAPLKSSSTTGAFRSSFLRSATEEDVSAAAGQFSSFTASRDSHAPVVAPVSASVPVHGSDVSLSLGPAASVPVTPVFGFSHLHSAAPPQKPAWPASPQAAAVSSSTPFGHYSSADNSQGFVNWAKPINGVFSFQGAAPCAATSSSIFGTLSSFDPAQAAAATHAAIVDHVTGRTAFCSTCYQLAKALPALTAWTKASPENCVLAQFALIQCHRFAASAGTAQSFLDLSANVHKVFKVNLRLSC